MKSKKNASVYQIKISLLRSKPTIWRRFLISGDCSLQELHDTIQVVMGWTDSHMHHFKIGRDFYGATGSDSFGGGNDFGEKDERRFSLEKLFPNEKAKFSYEYDMGDSWLHSLTVEKILDRNSLKVKQIPFCLAGKLACPPEDCGGIHGFYNLLEIVSDPGNDEYEEMIEWLGEEFDPEEFNLDSVNSELANL